MIVKIGCIVEGRGEVEAVPILIRRIVEDLYPELERCGPFVFQGIRLLKKANLNVESNSQLERLVGKALYLSSLIAMMIVRHI